MATVVMTAAGTVSVSVVAAPMVAKSCPQDHSDTGRRACTITPGRPGSGETVIQLHGFGPWKIEYLNPADDPRNAKRQ